jgi:hypothetical protein
MYGKRCDLWKVVVVLSITEASHLGRYVLYFTAYVVVVGVWCTYHVYRIYRINKFMSLPAFLLWALLNIRTKGISNMEYPKQFHLKAATSAVNNK